MKKAIFVGIIFFIFPISAWAGKFYFTLGNNIDTDEFDSVELSASSGGNYASSLDLGVTYYFNQKAEQSNFNLLSLDIFSSLESVQEYNFLFAAGIRPFIMTADLKPANEEDNNFSYGVLPGFDLGYRFPTTIPSVLLLSFDYVPNIIAGGDLANMLITNLLYEIMFTPIVITHISYRYGKASFNTAEKVPETTENFENSIGIGIKIRF